MDRFLIKKSIDPSFQQTGSVLSSNDNANNISSNTTASKSVVADNSTDNNTTNGKENKPATVVAPQSTPKKSSSNSNNKTENKSSSSTTKKNKDEKSNADQKKTSTPASKDKSNDKDKSTKESVSSSSVSASSSSSGASTKTATTATPKKSEANKKETTSTTPAAKNKAKEIKKDEKKVTTAATDSSKKDATSNNSTSGNVLHQTCVTNFFSANTSDVPVWKYLFEKEAAERAEQERIDREKREKEEEELRLKKEEERKKKAEQKKLRDKERRQREEEEWLEYQMAMESRNKGFEIIPNLYLGSFAAAKNVEWLTETGITKIVNVTSEVKCYFASKKSSVNEGSDIDSDGEEEEEEEEGKEGAEEGKGEGEEESSTPAKEKKQTLKIDYLRIPIADSSKAPIEEYFDNACKFMDEAIQAGQNVFVHCQQGRSRSPSIIIAYLMKVKGWDLEKSWIHVSKLNPRSLTVNDGFRKKLIHFEYSLFQTNSNLDFFLDDHKADESSERSTRIKNRRVVQRPIENDDTCVFEDDFDDAQEDNDEDNDGDDDIDVVKMDCDTNNNDKKDQSLTNATTVESTNKNTAVTDIMDEDESLIGTLEELKVVKKRRGNRVIED